MHCFGSYLGSGLVSYAVDEQNGKTNIDNVTFEAYFKDEKGQKVYNQEADINSKIKLYMSISVKEGTLKNVKLDFSNSNFKLENGQTQIEVNNQINAKETKEYYAEIVAKNDSTFNLDLLNMENKITITGKYINSNNEVKDLNAEKAVSIKWNSSNLTLMTEEERKETKVLTAEIITNKTYTIGEAQKRLIQVKVKSGIKNNIYPIEKTIITVNPLETGEMNEKEFTNGTKLTAEEVSVSAYSTKATNGKEGSADFGKTEENKLGSWQYNSETGITTITINNNKDENNNVTWTKNAVDEFVVTYIYNEESVKNAKAFRTTVENNLKLYTDEGEHKKTTGYWETSAEKAMPIELNVQVPESLSKKYILTGKEFAENCILDISTEKIGEEVSIIRNIDELNISNPNDIIPSTNYKSISINKEEFINILGENGKITILEPNTKEKIAEITKENETEDKTTLKAELKENVSQIEIKLSKPVKAGRIKINNSKVLIISNTKSYVEKVEEINKLKTTAIAKNSVYTTETTSKEIELKEPTTHADLAVELGEGKTSLPVGETNKVKFIVTLQTKGEEDKLFNNPTIEIALPQIVNELEVIKNTQDIAEQNGLDLKKIDVKDNKIIIELKGEQTENTKQDTTITFFANLKTSKLLATSSQDIKLTVTNGEEKAEDTEKIVFSANTGILLANSISGYNGEEPTIFSFDGDKEKSGLLNSKSEQAITATGKGTIINNTGKTLENTKVIGKGNLKVAMEGATIVYTKDQDVKETSNWNVEEYSEDVTGYKIEIPTIENTKIVEFTYTLTIPAKLGQDRTIELEYQVISGTKEIRKSPRIVLLTEQNINLELNVDSTAKNNESVYEGDKLLYSITIKNNGKTAVRNVKIDNSISEGATLEEGNQSSWTVEKIEPGESVTKEIQVKVNDLLEGELEKTITNTTVVRANYLEKELVKTITNKVEKSDIKVETSLQYGTQYYAGDVILHSLNITNITGKTIKDIKVTRHLAEGTEYYGRSEGAKIEGLTYEWNDQLKTATWNIKELRANETIKLNLKSIAEELEKDVNDKKIIHNFIIEYDGNKKISKSAYDGNIVKPNLDLKFYTSKEDLKVGEDVTYILEVKNITNYSTNSQLNIQLPTGITIKGISILKNDKVEKVDNYQSNQFMTNIDVNKNETIKVIIMANASDSFETEKTVKAEASVVVYGSNSEGNKENPNEVFSKTVESSLAITDIPEVPDNPVKPNPEDPVIPTKPDSDKPDPVTPDPDKPNQPDSDNPTEKTYSISGVAWLDENENGEKDLNERLLKGILVRIKKINKDKVAEYLKDENGEEITSITNNEGKYAFEKLEPGQYILEFKYNTKTYKLTQVANKDSVPYESKTSEGTTVKTDTLNLTNSNIEKINIGLVLNSTFDLELNKYIKRAVVQNDAGTTEYNYNNEQLAKLEIRAKQMSSSTVFIEYVIEVKNNGAVPGTAQVVADYLPKGLKFNSEMNMDWYQGTDGNLYTEQLKDEIIEPGETKQISLILTKTMTDSGTGTFVNAAEIYEDKNDFGLVDTNSTPANQEEKENDYSTAEIMISTATGSPIMYIGIVIACMLILGGGIYIINKKVINGKKSV